MSASEASGGAMMRIGSPERRTSTNTTIDTTTSDTSDCTKRPRMYRGKGLAGGAHQFVVRLRRHVGQRRPAADLLRHRPRDRLHPEHDAVIAVVELLAEIARELHAPLGIELPHDRVDLLDVGAVDQQVEGGLGVDHALPASDGLVE